MCKRKNFPKRLRTFLVSLTLNFLCALFDVKNLKKNNMTLFSADLFFLFLLSRHHFQSFFFKTLVIQHNLLQRNGNRKNTIFFSLPRNFCYLYYLIPPNFKIEGQHLCLNWLQGNKIKFGMCTGLRNGT